MVTVASLLQIMDYVDSLDLSRDLQLIHTKSFINKLYLVLNTCVEIFDAMLFFTFKERVYGSGNPFPLKKKCRSCHTLTLTHQ